VVSAITKADDPVSECRQMLAIIRDYGPAKK